MKHCKVENIAKKTVIEKIEKRIEITKSGE